MLRVPVILSFVAVSAGVIWFLAVGSLLAAALVIGGVAGLGLSMAPAAIDFFVRWLSVGR